VEGISQYPDPGGAAAMRSGDAARRCRVLVVDDDDLVRAHLTTLLQTSQFDVESAASGEDALRVMTKTHCEILLTDWLMPEMDGLSLCRNVRKHENDGYVYVMMHTVRDSKEDFLSGLAAGADDYVVKGAPVEELLARMEVARRVSLRESAPDSGLHESWRLAATDSLTGTNNLSHLMKHLPRELARARRDRHALAILSCGVDEFEDIIVRCGEAAGDELLRTFVARAAGCVRKESDWFARAARDEFIFVLPKTTVHGAHCVAQKLRSAVALDPVATSAGSLRFTVSIGMTAIEPKGEGNDPLEVEDVLRAVDRGLCASRKRGGDHVTAAAVSSGITIAVGVLIGTQHDLH
jgi:two-component system chemotaxis response regulator CheY